MSFGLGDIRSFVRWHAAWLAAGVLVAVVGMTCGYSLVWMCLV